MGQFVATNQFAKDFGVYSEKKQEWLIEASWQSAFQCSGPVGAFIGVFIAGSALAGLGGVMWGLYEEVITAHMGGSLMVLVFIVVIIGGLGSVEGCFIGALLVGLLQNYAAFLEPKLALISNIGLMVAILMWRPQGMMPVVKAK